MRSSSHMVRFGALAVAAAGLALTTTACSKKLDPTSSANSIKTQANSVLTSAQSPVTISTVTCPNDIEAKAGVSFTCQVKLSDGKSVDIKATQVDDNGQFTVDPAPLTAAIVGSVTGGVTPPTT